VLARRLASIAAAAAAAAIFAGAGAGGVAHAQPATDPVEPKFPDAIQPPPGFDIDPAWAAYDSAFRDAAAGDVKLARSRLKEIVARWPNHPALPRVQALLGRLGSRAKGSNATSNVARGEFVFWTTLGGVSLAANLCEALDCTTDREYAGVYTLTIGSALGLSLFGTRRGIHQGEAQLYNSAQTWAAWNALLVNDGFPETSGEASVAIAMQLGGLAAGLGLWQAWRPTQGDVALTNSFLLWGTMMTLWGYVAADEEPTLRSVIAAGDVAILVGALVSREVRMSRGRTLLIDIGGVLGTLVGGLIGTSVSSQSTNETGLGVALMLGTGAGLGIAFVATRDWDKDLPVKVAPAVLSGPGRTPGYGVSAAFAF
jgi:hypothetical protein